MSAELRFDDQVVVITGAGNGLGRAYATEFSKRGGRVIVNDIGRAETNGADQWQAELVAEEINAAGGEAVANTDSVIHGERIIESALDYFGRVDVLINNAGILRDRSFHKLDENDWRDIQSVHLDGAYAITRAAWPLMREAQYGRVLFTSSAAGLYGNFGQANYAAAKMGLIGLGRSLAIEGKSRGIKVNMIAPVAASQLTATVMPATMLEQLGADLVTPLVVCLAHKSCEESGEVFEVGGGWVTRLRWERSDPVAVSSARDGFSAEALSQEWPQLNSFTRQDHPRQVSDTFQAISELSGISLDIKPQAG